MKIAVVVPPEESVPPKTYGGTELVAYNLVRELMLMGHDVTLIASGDSKTPARLIAPFKRSMRQAGGEFIKYRSHFHHIYIGKVVDVLAMQKFDIVHNHIGWPLLAFSRGIPSPMITTLHGPMDVEDQQIFHNAFASANYVSISKNQRKPMPHLNYVANVYNGIELDRFMVNTDKKRKHLVFLGRFSPEKGPAQAIEIAQKTNLPLIMAGKIDSVDAKYFKESVQPLIDGTHIRFIGEVNHPQKVKLLGEAIALINPVQWEEPFGLVNAEALACGTPVVALRRGSLPELIQHGKVGFICDTVEDMVTAIKNIGTIQVADCRAHAQANFSSSCMANGYLQVYKKILHSPVKSVVTQRVLSAQ